MKTKALTQLVIILLIAAISCTKESDNISPTTRVATQNSSDALAESLDNDVTQLTIVGKWILFYDWNCDGKYYSTTMKVESGGSWAMPKFNYTGEWVTGRRIFMFTFDNTLTTYSGVICDKEIRGIMTTWSGLQGCFYMKPYEANNLKQEEDATETGTFDVSGKKQ
jgi:hypothetical protein